MKTHKEEFRLKSSELIGKLSSGHSEDISHDIHELIASAEAAISETILYASIIYAMDIRHVQRIAANLKNSWCTTEIINSVIDVDKIKKIADNAEESERRALHSYRITLYIKNKIDKLKEEIAHHDKAIDEWTEKGLWKHNFIFWQQLLFRKERAIGLLLGLKEMLFHYGRPKELENPPINSGTNIL